MPRTPKKTPAERPKRLRPPMANELRKLRDDQGLTLFDAFKATGATRAAISRWENGQGEPAEKFRAKYAAFLGITKRQLGGIVYGD